MSFTVKCQYRLMCMTDMMLFVVMLLTLAGVNGFMFDDPCELSPTYGGNNDHYTVHVPRQCVNGTFRWDYPQGQTLLVLSNPQHEPTVICFKDWMLGEIFHIVDVTSSTSYALDTLKRDNTVCTHSRTEETIKIRVDGTKTVMYYVAGVEYTVTH